MSEKIDNILTCNWHDLSYIELTEAPRDKQIHITASVY